MAAPATTADELMRSPDRGRCELLRGERVRKPEPSAEHERIVRNFAEPLAYHVRVRDLGAVAPAGTGFLLARDPDTVRTPDIAVVGLGKVAPPSPGESGYLDSPPDIAIEVLERDEPREPVEERVKEWLDAGVRAVWVVDPVKRHIVMQRPGTAPSTMRHNHLLSDPQLLPGFRIRTQVVFDS